jgi:hypothetical protein
MSGSSTTSLTYEGPRALIVELEKEVNHGDVVLDVDDDLVPKLLQVMGVREATKAEEKKAREALKKAQEEAEQDDSSTAPSEDTGGSSPEGEDPPA